MGRWNRPRGSFGVVGEILHASLRSVEAFRLVTGPIMRRVLALLGLSIPVWGSGDAGDSLPGEEGGANPKPVPGGVNLMGGPGFGSRSIC